MTNKEYENQTKTIVKGSKTITYINDIKDNPGNKKTAINLLRELVDVGTIDLNHKLVNNIENFYNYTHFWKRIQENRLMKYLEFATDATLINTARSLLCAFKYPGTYEGFISLAHGIFGKESIVIIEDYKKPAVLSIKINNANESFLLALAEELGDEKVAIAIKTDDINDRISEKKTRKYFTLVIADIEDAVTHDTYGFFRLFLTPGRVLSDLIIDFSVTKEKNKEHDYIGGLKCLAT